MIERYAPAGKIWLCMMCGKTAKDCCTDERGWDESCAMNCILVDEATKQPTEAEVQLFVQERERHMANLTSNFDRLLKNLESGNTDDLDPELLELAQQAIDRMEARAASEKPADGVQYDPVPETFNKEKRNG